MKSIDGYDGNDGNDGSMLGQTLSTVRRWLDTYICVSEDVDLDVLTLWVAHTWVAFETYTSPRLILDSMSPGSGKTTVLDHFQRLAYSPVQMASISSPALLARLLNDGPRTLMIDEVDRTLDPKSPGTPELLSILNTGYRRGATRPVLVSSKGNDWTPVEMPTYGPVVMAGNAPHLPDDTRSRAIRVLLMPDVYGVAEDSDWELIEPDALDIRDALSEAMERIRDDIRASAPALPEGCMGRMKEKWRPLARIADVAQGRWPAIVNELIERDMAEIRAERDEGLTRIPPGMRLIQDLQAVWSEDEAFLGTSALIDRLVQHSPDYWGESSTFGSRLTPQRFGKMAFQATKARSAKNGQDVRGWKRIDFQTAFRRSTVDPSKQPSKPSGTSEPSGAKEANTPFGAAFDDPGCCPHGVTIGARCGACGGVAG